MTKAELIDKVSEAAGEKLTKKQIGEIIEATFEAVGDAVKEGRFSYPGFGTFTVKTRAAREGINPRTKEKLQIPASKSIGFKPAAKLKDTL